MDTKTTNEQETHRRTKVEIHTTDVPGKNADDVSGTHEKQEYTLN